MSQITNNKIQLHEIIFIAVVATAIGIFWWGYSFFYDLLAPVLRVVGLQHFLLGIFHIAGIFFMYVIRKPGSAILGETIASFVEAMISQWGIASLIWAVFEGVAVEMVFYITRYKSFKYRVLIIAAIVSATSGFFVSFIYYQYWLLKPQFVLLNFGCDVTSAIIFAGLLAKYLADKLAKTGVLSQFKIVKESSVHSL